MSQPRHPHGKKPAREYGCRWFGVTIIPLGAGPHVWAIYVRIGRKRKIEVVYR